MLDLTVLNNAAPGRPPRDLDSRADTWYSPDGTVYARVCVERQRGWLRIPGVADYRIDPVKQIAAFPYPKVRVEAIHEAYRRMVLPFAIHMRGTEVLHASAVSTPRGVVGICGRSQSGKSTIAYALSLRGYPLWADDAVPFEAGADSIHVRPVPFKLRLRLPSRQHFSAEGTPLPRQATPGIRDVTIRESGLLAAVCILDRGSHERISARRLTSAQAFSAILPHAYCLTLRERARKRGMIQQYLRLAAAVPVFEIRFPTGLDNLTGILDAIEGTVIHAKQPNPPVSALPPHARLAPLLRPG